MPFKVNARPWRDAKQKPFAGLAARKHIRTFQERKEEKLQLKAALAKQQAIYEEIAAQKRCAAAKRKAKQERKQENVIKSAIRQQGVQLLADPKKVRKAEKKAKCKVFAVAPELLQHYYG